MPTGKNNNRTFSFRSHGKTGRAMNDKYQRYYMTTKNHRFDKKELKSISRNENARVKSDKAIAPGLIIASNANRLLLNLIAVSIIRQ